MTLELRQLIYAVATARAGSFSRAANELGLAQPSLSAAISQLESELGVKLFERSSRGVVPTAVGAYVVRQGQRVLRDVDELRSTVRSMASGATGAITFGVAPVLAWQSAPAIMRAFTAAWPDAELSVRERNASEIIELLIEGAIDVGMVATASTAHLRDFHRGVLVVEALGSVNLIAALPQRYAASADPISLAEIADEEIAIPPPSTRTFGLRAGILRAFDQAGIPTPRIRDVPSLFEAIPLAMAGIAVAIIPEGMRSAITSPDLVLRSIHNGPAPLDISLLRGARNTSPAVTRFARIARETMRDQMKERPSAR
ncbi:LysR family transcriptional regulator [Microbacterium sp. E-13]|uniref:LysR family transcriptional regulator n=1 Tax=Microbacterium sp. E-13 TaxID=3404048 RepID=UPI003CF87EF1